MYKLDWILKMGTLMLNALDQIIYLQFKSFNK